MVSLWEILHSEFTDDLHAYRYSVYLILHILVYKYGFYNSKDSIINFSIPI